MFRLIRVICLFTCSKNYLFDEADYGPVRGQTILTVVYCFNIHSSAPKNIQSVIAINTKILVSSTVGFISVSGKQQTNLAIEKA